MTTTRDAATESRRKPIAAVASLMPALILAAMFGTLCVARVAFADPAPLAAADYVGRWTATNKPLTLDITRCDKGFCGVIVTDGACGYTALRADESDDDARYQTATERVVSGRLQLAAKTVPYGVKVILLRNDSGAPALQIIGHTGGVFSPMRRGFDYRALMVRAGEPTCQPNPKTS